MLISCDVLRMSQLICSFIVISLGCLSSFAHLFRFFSSSFPPPSQLLVLSSSAPPPQLLPSRPPPGDHKRRTGRSTFVVARGGPGWVRLPPNTHVSIIRAHSATQPLSHPVTPYSFTHSLTSHLQSFKRAKEEERRGQ